MGVKIETPNFIYGTAWKKDETARLAHLAVTAGFRAIDTANQACHYQEALVGEALLKLADEGVSRDQYWLQTKFTSAESQDGSLPYDSEAAVVDQVEQSFASSLQHLHTEYLDSYLLHGPSTNQGLADADWEAWSAIEAIYQSGQSKLIGVSNVNVEQLELLLRQAEVKPMAVQNRCYASRGWDSAVRKLCEEHDIMYQGFSLLTANKPILKDQKITRLAQQYRVTPSQIVFRFAHQVGMTPLTGTSNELHMKEDLAIFDFELGAEELAVIEKLGLSN